MIKFDAGANITTSDADLIVNTVNTVGVMGAGVAKAVKDRYPDVMPPYTEACRTKKLYPGGVQILRMKDGRIIANLASKEHFKDPSRPEWVGYGLLNLNRILNLEQMKDVKTVLLPPPGAGLGGLKREMVQRMILSYMKTSSDRGVDITCSMEQYDLNERPVRYAGIGSRETPPEAMRLMTETAEMLAENGWILRSGNAIGADKAFEVGSPVKQTESYLPWEKGDVPHGITETTRQHELLMRTTYKSPSGQPWNSRMSRSSTLLMTRNGCQMFGTDFTEPTDIVICWTPDGHEIGGTRQALVLAKLNDIPVINLGEKRWQNATSEDVVEEAFRSVQKHRGEIGLATQKKPEDPAPGV